MAISIQTQRIPYKIYLYSAVKGVVYHSFFTDADEPVYLMVDTKKENFIKNCLHGYRFGYSAKKRANSDQHE
jgi:hypothetical protein